MARSGWSAAEECMSLSLNFVALTRGIGSGQSIFKFLDLMVLIVRVDRGSVAVRFGLVCRSHVSQFGWGRVALSLFDTCPPLSQTRCSFHRLTRGCRKTFSLLLIEENVVISFHHSHFHIF